jgi:hypothetical protein
MAFFDDHIVSDIVQDQILFRISQQSPFVASGVASITNDAQGGGNFYSRRVRNEDLERAKVIDGTTIHTPSTLGAEKDISPVLRRVRPRLVVDGVKAAEGRLSANPTEDLIAQSASYWQREFDEALLACINAAFDGTDGCLRTSHRSVIATSSAPYVAASYGAVIKAAKKAGDSIGDYAAVVVHSDVWADLTAENAAKSTFLPLGGSAPALYLGGLRVIISDGVPTSGSGASKAYTSILLRPGALYVAIQQPLREHVAAEPFLPGLKFSESLHWACGLEGLKWNETTSNPSNVALADPTSWVKTAASPSFETDKRQIGCIALVSNATT